MSNEVHKSKTGSKRFNNGKPEVSQLDPRFILELSNMMTKSAKKYGKYNWALGQEFHTPFDSCMRHLLKFMEGENVDEESGLNHLIHAAANLMIMYSSQRLNDSELDTRFDWNRNKVVTHNGLTEDDLNDMFEEEIAKRNDRIQNIIKESL